VVREFSFVHFTYVIIINTGFGFRIGQGWKRLAYFFACMYVPLRSRGSVVGIATGYGLKDRGVGVQVPVGSRIFSSPRLSDRLWDPPNLLFNGYRGKVGRGVKLTTHLQLVPRSRKYGSIHPLPHTLSWHSA
jgi:hypothetical protein